MALRENEQLYMKDEKRRAKLAHDFICNSGYSSIGEGVHILTDGNVRNIPEIRPADVERAYKIKGEHPEYVHGQLVRKTVSRTPVDHTLRHDDKNLKVYADVMHVDGEMFLVLVADPLNLTLQSKVENESRNMLSLGLQSHLVTFRSRGYEPRVVYIDPHSSFKAMTQDFPNIEIDVGGSGHYMAKVDAKIRRIKETYRKVKQGLPWKLPAGLVRDLVGYAVSRLNIRRTQALSGNVCPRVLFTGIPVPYKELSIAFGDYVEAYEGTDNTSGAKSTACIALCPVGNSSGAWALWKLSTCVRVRRTNFKKLVTMELVIGIMNAHTEENVNEASQPLVGDVITQQPATEAGLGENPGVIPVEVQEMIQGDGPTEIQGENPAGGQEEDPAEIQGEDPTEIQEEIQTATQVEEPVEIEDIAVQEETITSEKRTGSGRTVKRPKHFVAVTKVSRSE